MAEAAETRAMYGACTARIASCKFGWPTTYEVAFVMHSGLQTITRRYTDFERLRDSLVALPGTRMPLPDLPPKAVSSMFLSSFRDERQEALGLFLAEAIDRSNLTSEPWCEFLGFAAGSLEASRPSSESSATSPQTPAHLAAAASEASAPWSAAEGQPRSELDDIREMRRQRWRQSAGTSSSSAQGPPATDPGPVPSPIEEPLQPLSRMCMLPMQELPEELDGERLSLLKESLKRMRDQGLVVDVGTVIEGHSGFRFCIIKCSPDRGLIDASTVFFTNGPVLTRLDKVELMGLRQHVAGESEDAARQQLFNDHVAPYFRSVFSDPSRCGVVCLGDTPKQLGVRFEVTAIQPELHGWGIVDNRTEIFARLHPLPEFTKIHVVPFIDTLPSAYDYDIFRDYVAPFFDIHRSDGFQAGQTFTHNGVEFKVKFTEPFAGPCRVAAATNIFSDGRLEPTAGELLSPDVARQLAIYPPGLQLILLHGTYFGNGEIADRIMAAQTSRSRAMVNAATLQNSTEEASWSRENLRGDDTEQTECIVCLSDFQEGDRIRILPCRHVFHTGCIDEWLGRDAHCPLCRHGLSGGRRRR